ncbi:hypothetical protein F6B93_14055 [Mycobacterium spongiae]|uniref:Uncharacterized protein n=2 Tax=Mycobacterium spongiae TaxID=886343 RepID=A0A975PZN5_9MYCO|nr:hypothetical protein F6B93_14055 [Mycobacterium spongiae]
MTNPVTTEPTPINRLRGPSVLAAIGLGFVASCGLVVGGLAHAAPAPTQVRYEVTGSGGTADYLSYQTRSGQRREANVPLPWSTEFDGYLGQVLVLSAQGPGTIACRILVNGDEVKSASAAGQPARTVCSVTAAGITKTPTTTPEAPPTG